MELALAYSYTLGFVAAFNPCGFALLPAYLSYFLGIEPVTASGSGSSTSDSNILSGSDAAGTVTRAFMLGLTLTAGFVAVFGGFGLLFETILNQRIVLERIGYVTIFIGASMMIFGAAMFVMTITGQDLNLRFLQPLQLLKPRRSVQGRGFISVFMFGISYALVSMSCTIALFISAISATFTDEGFLSGIANFIAYSLGMGCVITFLTVALALARTGVVGMMRKALRWIPILSPLVLILVGAYLVNYGWWELQIIKGEIVGNVLVEWFEVLQNDVSSWISRTTPKRLGVLSIFGLASALLLSWRKSWRKRHKQIVAAAYISGWLAVEIANRGDFVLLPVVLFLLGWPERVNNWVVDPWRFGVAGELIFISMTIFMCYKFAHHKLARAYHTLMRVCIKRIHHKRIRHKTKPTHHKTARK